MRMTPGIRKLALTAHVMSSVGWLGAVGAFLALASAGLRSEDPDLVWASDLAMQLTGWSVIVPLCLASLPSGRLSGPMVFGTIAIILLVLLVVLHLTGGGPRGH